MKNILVLILCLGVLSAHAQQKMVISLDSAISYAILHNKVLINSRYSIDKSQQQVREAIAQGLPQVSAKLDYTNYLGAEASLQLNPMAPPIIIEFNPTSNFQASVSQLVFNGSYYVGVQLTKLAKLMTEQSYQKDEMNIKEQTTQAYYMILASEKILQTMRENKRNAQIIYDKTQHLANAGILEPIEAKKLSVMLTSVDNAIKSSERQVELAYNLLRFQLGLNANEPIELATPLEEIIEKMMDSNKANEDFSVQNNIDYQLISKRVELARKTIDLRKASYLPSVVAFYSYTEKIQKAAFDMQPNNILGLSLNIPVFSSGLRLAQLNQAKVDYLISQNTQELVKQQLSTQEKQLRYNYLNLMEQYMNQKNNVEIAKEVLDNMNLKYQQGVVSSLELTSANNNYLNAEISFTGTILELLNSELSLRKINNKL